MKKVNFLLLFTFCCCSTIFSQSTSLAEKLAANALELPYESSDPKCTTMDAIEYRLANDPSYAQYYNATRAIPQVPSQSKIPCDGMNSIVVPVAFHFAPGVVTCGDTDCLLAEVQDQLDAMNIAFGDNTAASATMVGACPAAYGGGADVSTGTCISFCLAIPPVGNAEGLDPACDPPITIGEFTGGFGAGGNGAPGWGGIMNLFITNGGCLGVADGIPGAANGDGVSTCSVAFGGMSPSSGCGLDTDATFGLGATMIHEIGHYLGLYHTFQGGCGDEPGGPGPFSVTDTPPASNPYFGCNMATCEASGCGGGVQGIANFMDYTDDACMTMFTEDQAQVMNYWANQLFGATASQCSDPNPTQLTSACLMQPCVLVCPAVVTAPYAGAEEICAIAGDYTLPTDFSAVVLDDASDAVYSWSTGNYLSAGGTAAAATYTPAPPTCAPEEVTFYLNVDCGTTPLAAPLDAGTFVLTAYPDPMTFVVDDLVTFTDGTCAAPTWVVTAGCEAFVTVVATDAPGTINSGDAGTVNHDVTLNYPLECCCPTTMATQTEANTTPVDIPDNGGIGNPGCSTVTIPAGGSITDVVIDLGVTHTWVGDLIITVTSPAGTTIDLGAPAGCTGDDLAVTFDDAATSTAADFAATCNNLPAIAGAFQPTDALSAFDGEDAAGDWVLCISDNANFDTGSIDNFGITVITEEPCTDNAECVFTGMANYNCMATDVGYCDNICFAEYNAAPDPDDFVDVTLCVTALSCADSPDASCLMTAPCDDTDPCTENETVTTIIETGEECVACGGGTPVAQCTLPSVAQACDDGDPCTTNDMEEVDACDATIVCVPCAGTVDPTSCDAACTSTVACDDGDPCTTGEEEILAADGSVCTPCGLNAMPVTPACGDPAATNYDMNATCIDNTVCTYGEYCDDICFAEYTATPGPSDTPNATLCVTPVGCAGDASCLTTIACDDGDPCTTGEMETSAPDGSVCVPCGGGTAVTPACGDPTATNYDMNATCIDNTLCQYAGADADITDPCFCDNPVNEDLDGDGEFDIFFEVITISTTPSQAGITDWVQAFPIGTPLDNTGTAVAPTIVDNGDGTYDIAFYLASGQSYTADFTSVSAGFDLTVSGGGCVPCPTNIPTVGEWGLIILGLMMSIVAIVGIRERKTNEIYS